MDKKIEGSWLIHHTNKLQAVTSQGVFENTYAAGKAGILLSAISSSNQFFVENDRLQALAQASSINKLELPMLITTLIEKELISRGEHGVEVLGVTTASTLQHTSDIFQDLQPSKTEIAAIDLAERASQKPLDAHQVKEELSDLYRLDSKAVDNILYYSEKIGFVDVENIDDSQKIYFNGNLFKRDSAMKAKTVLDSLNSQEQVKLNQIYVLLHAKTCLPVTECQNILGSVLFSKVSAIGLFDISVVSNSEENTGFITLPAAFSKYSSPMVDDAFDLAKAFVSSLTYGMTKSPYERGQIQMIERLLGALIRGEWIGPVAAIGQDYQILELKGVVQVKAGRKKGRVGPMMKLLKKEVGELALLAIKEGDVSEQSLLSLPGATVTQFFGPEVNREKIRRNQIKHSPKVTNDMLTALRTGGF